MATEEVPELVKIAARIDDFPTLEEIDAMLHALHDMESTLDVKRTFDELLDLRSALTSEAWEPRTEAA